MLTSDKGVVYSPGGEVMLLLNDRHEWELPGGRLEVGESSCACLAREIREELDVRVRVGRPIDTYLFEAVPGKHVFIATYRCTVLGPFDPSPSQQHECLGLFEPTALPENLPAGYRALIEASVAGC